MDDVFSICKNWNIVFLNNNNDDDAKQLELYCRGRFIVVSKILQYLYEEGLKIDKFEADLFFRRWNREYETKLWSDMVTM
jgi:hypothetical protein